MAIKIAGVTNFTTSSHGRKEMIRLLSAVFPGRAFRSSISAWAWEAAEYSASAPRIPEANKIKAKAAFR